MRATIERTPALFAVVLLAIGTAVPAAAQAAPAQQAAAPGSARQYVVILKHGPKWLPGKGAAEQPLLTHRQYLKELADKGTLRLAGPFLDDSGGLILLNVGSEADARRLEEQDPGVVDGILAIDTIRPIRILFDASAGKSPSN